MRKVLIFSTAYFPFVGGAEIAVKEITKRIEGWQFDMLTARMDRNLPRFERIDNVNVYRMGFGFQELDKYIFSFFGFFKALKLYFSNRYQVVWPIMAAYSSFVVLFKIFFPKTKILLTLQEGDPVEYIMNLKRFKFFWPIYKFYFKKADHVQAISNFLAEWATELGVDKEKITVVPNGVDIEHFQANVGMLQLSELYNYLKIDINEKLIITTSRLVKKNAVSDIIEALKFLPTDVKLLILGSGPLEKQLEQQTSDMGLLDRIIFVKQVDHKELPRYLKISHVFVRPSLSEGLGSSFLEAMAAGVPVIGTPVGGIPDFLKDPSNTSGQAPTGLFCEVRSPKSIAEQVERIFKDDGLREKIVKNAKKLVEERYSWNLIAEKMEDIFNKLCAF